VASVFKIGRFERRLINVVRINQAEFVRVVGEDLQPGNRADQVALTVNDHNRRLAAILGADVVGYSRLVSADEADASARLSG